MEFQALTGPLFPPFVVVTSYYCCENDDGDEKIDNDKEVGLFCPSLLLLVRPNTRL